MAERLIIVMDSDKFHRYTEGDEVDRSLGQIEVKKYAQEAYTNERPEFRGETIIIHIAHAPNGGYTWHYWMPEDEYQKWKDTMTGNERKE